MLLSNWKGQPLFTEIVINNNIVDVNIVLIDLQILSDNRRDFVKTKHQVCLDDPAKGFEVIFFSFVLCFTEF